MRVISQQHKTVFRGNKTKGKIKVNKKAKGGVRKKREKQENHSRKRKKVEREIKLNRERGIG